MTEPATVTDIDDETIPTELTPAEPSAGPWLIVVAGVALLLALCIVLALIAASRPPAALS